MGGLELFPSGPAADEGAWTISQLTTRARQVIETGIDRVWVRGEVTGFKVYGSGHWYFGLRDAHAQVRCVMWRLDAQRVREAPAEGMQVYAEGRPTVWEEKGEFRLTVKQLIRTDDEGPWQLKLARARAALERDGLLDPARKKPLPLFPDRIAIVTSLDGAALGDIVTVARRRWPATELWVIPTRVQGDAAERSLCASLTLVNRLRGVDLVIVGRGGGSREDLWAFNSERVARAVAAVTVPTISAVGHETDISLTDLVADVRAPTPSAAAEAALPDRLAAGDLVNALARRLGDGLLRRTTLVTERLARTADRLMNGVEFQMERGRSDLERLGATLDALSPLRVLRRGYAVARGDDGRVLSRVAEFVPGGAFRLAVSDGEVRAEVR